MNRRSPGKDTQARALLYGLPADTEAGEIARGLLRALGIERIEVGQAELAKQVGVSAGLLMSEHPPGMKAPIPVDSATAEQQAEVESATAVFFLACTKEQVRQFLAAYAQSGAEPIRLKSMLTEHNIHWTLHELLLELHEEHRFMLAFNRLYAARQSVAQFLEDGNYTRDSREALRPAYERATAFIERVKAREVLTPTQLDEEFIALEEAAQRLIPEI